MKKITLKAIAKNISLGLFWSVVSVLIASLLSKELGYSAENVVFTIGIICLMLGVFSYIESSPSTVSAEISNADVNEILEAKQLDSDRNDIFLKTTFIKSLITSSFVISGILNIIMSFII